MAIITNTFTRFDAKGLREQLSDIIYDISPQDTPFISSAGKEKATQTLFEWQTDSLAAAVATNQQIEGDDITTFPAVTATVRVGNHAQIARKLIILSGTLEVVDKAGRRSELAYQLAKRGTELKRDMETNALGNVGGDAGSTSAARKTATLGAWVKTNTDFGTGGVDPTYTSGVPGAARTDGTQRAFTETQLKTVAKEVYISGGDMDVLMVGPFNKGVVSGFSGVVTRNYDISNMPAKPTAVIAAVDVFVTDWGTLRVVPNRFQRDRDAWLLDFEFLSMATLRPFQTVQLAKTGDADKRMILIEYGLKVKAEAALGLVADLTTS